MPSKKKKYNARFPPARIKKIMQTDEDVGKVAAAVPVIISRALELFIESLITKASDTTRSRNAKTLSTQHIKHTILGDDQFDFLKDLVANIPDVAAEEDDAATPSTSSGEGPSRGRGRPRKKSVPPAVVGEGDEGSSSQPSRSLQEDSEETEDAETESADEDSEDESSPVPPSAPSQPFMPAAAALGAPPPAATVKDEPSSSAPSVPAAATDVVAPTLTTARHFLGPRIPLPEPPRTHTATADTPRFHRPFATSPPSSGAPSGHPIGFPGCPSSPMSGFGPRGYMPPSIGAMDQKEAGNAGSPRPSYPVPAGMYMPPGGYYPMLPQGPGNAIPYSGLSSIPGVSIPAAVSVATDSLHEGVPGPQPEQGSPSLNWQHSPVAMAGSPPDRPQVYPASHPLPQVPSQHNSR